MKRYHATSVQSSRPRRVGFRLFPPPSPASTTPTASSPRTPPSRPRASARSRACSLEGSLSGRDRQIAKKICATGISPRAPAVPHARSSRWKRPSVAAAIIRWGVRGREPRARYSAVTVPLPASRDLRYKKIDLAGSGRQVPWRPCA
jgi:hypothetical protein